MSRGIVNYINIMSSIHYYQDELVWAKIKGFSWWPGVVSSVDKGKDGNETQITVNFVGENSHAVLTLDKVMKYREGYAQCSQTKKRSLLDAIETANRIEAGTTTYIDEKEKLKKKNKAREETDKKGVESKKRKLPEKSIEPPANVTRSITKKTMQVDKKSLPIILKEGFYLKRTQSFFKKLMLQSSKAIMAKKAKVKESLKEIAGENITVNQLQETRLGFDLQQFANVCSKTPLLAKIKDNVQMVLNKLKLNAISSLFGGEENSSLLHDADKKLDEAELNTDKKTRVVKRSESKAENAKESDNKDNNELINSKLNEELKEKLPETKIENNNQEDLESKKDKDPELDKEECHKEQVKEVVKEEQKVEPAVEIEPEPIKVEKVRDESKQRGSMRAAKEPAMMLIVCREIARLLEEVWYSH
jgi:hypothetical protein